MIGSVPSPGSGLIRASWVGTFALIVAAIGAVISPGTAVAVPLIVVALALFVSGSVAMAWSYAIAIRRSRTDEIAVAGLYFLAGGAADRDVRRALMGALVVQAVVGFAAAAARPFTAAAFGILAPVWGLGLTGLWAARHGSYPPRQVAAPRRRT